MKSMTLYFTCSHNARLYSCLHVRKLKSFLLPSKLRIQRTCPQWLVLFNFSAYSKTRRKFVSKTAHAKCLHTNLSDQYSSIKMPEEYGNIKIYSASPKYSFKVGTVNTNVTKSILYKTLSSSPGLQPGTVDNKQTSETVQQEKTSSTETPDKSKEPKQPAVPQETGKVKCKESLPQVYGDIVNSFPDGIQMAFVYGSGAIQAANSRRKEENVLDVILVVDNPRQWHRRNLELHPHHYTVLRKLGARTIASFQERYGAGVYFNALVPMYDRLVKYGVVSTNRLYADLLDWESLYVAGRLHKPVYFVVVPQDERIITALKVNLRSAVHAASLLLPDGFSEEELYMTISGLSYPNVDRQKISRMVRPNIGMFRRMYSPFLLEDEHLTWWPDEGVLEQALTYYSRHHHLKQLPCRVLLNLLTRRYQVGQFPDLEEVIRRHAFDSDCDQHVAQSIRNIVQKSSFTQSSKDLLTCRLSRSLAHTTSNIWWHLARRGWFDTGAK